MSAIEPLNVTVELPESEMMEHEGAILVRCQKCRTWADLADYYSEADGLLPLVGNASCGHNSSGFHWVSDEDKVDSVGNQVLKKEALTPCDWSEVVRIVASPKSDAEGGTLAFNTADKVASEEKFG